MPLSIDLLRPDDLLALHIDAINLRLDVSRPRRPKLVLEQRNNPAFLVVRFPPQSIIEQAYFQATPPLPPPPAFNPPPDPPLPLIDDPLDPPGSVGERMTGDSRLVFRLPAAIAEIPYTLEGLLDWSKLELVLPPAARIPPSAAVSSPPAITEPGPLETAIEIPYRLLIAPTLMRKQARPGWIHARQPVMHGGRAELWHTRLARVTPGPGGSTSAAEANDRNLVPLRAVWSPDFVGDGPLPSHAEDNVPFRAAMSARDRDQIVILTSGFKGYTLTDAGGAETTYVPEPVNASRLFLSALGGWLTSRGDWKSPVSYRFFRPLPGPLPVIRDHREILPVSVQPLDLVEWCHIAAQGRDQYVRIVYDGFLYPFGHRASLIKVTERKVKAPDGAISASPVAYLRQRMYVVVREQEKTYVGAPYTFAGREMPFARRVRINTHVTPDIDPPAFIDGGASFWVDTTGKHFQFHVTAQDLSGSNVDFLAPLVFVSLSETQLARVRTAYLADDARRCAVPGRNVAYADPAAGDTVIKTRTLYFDSQITQPAPPFPVAPFIPTLDRASVTIPAIAQLLGQQVAVIIGLYRPYLQNNLDAKAGVFAEILGTAPGVKFSADKAGGFATPNIALTALSARKGLVSGSADDAAAGVIDPAAYFGDIDARLFGTIDLGQLIPIDAVTRRANADQNAPEIRTRALPNRKNPTQLVTNIAWEPQLQDYSRTPVSITFNQDGPSALKLHVRIERNLDGTPPVFKATGQLTNFRLDLLGVVALKFAAINFTSQNGEKANVAAHLAKNPIAFDGPLAFVQTLASILPSGLFGGAGPSIQATATALRVTYTLGFPPVTTGVFSLQHIAIMTGLDLPYLDGKPAFEFAFASRNRPFLVTVEIFGGGGFVHVVLDTDGVQMVEGAIEFGGNFALDIGVATGAVHALAGIYFQLKGSSSDLTGFVDVGGEVTVLGIISISIDLNLSLSWQSSPQGNVIQGRATLTVSVHVLFFSASVALSVERSFSAGSGDPKVFQLVDASQWSQYAAAFA